MRSKYSSGAELQENALKTVVLQQHTCPQRKIGSDRQLAAPVPRGGKLLLAARLDDLSVFANDAAECYGSPITKFERTVILAGQNAVFVIDRIAADTPVCTIWNWLLNNRDGELDFKLVYPDRLVARRGNAGMKMFHLGKNSSLGGPNYAYVHDAYHPLPQQPGEGAPGSGMLFNWTEKTPSTEKTTVHAIAVDEYGIVSGWHLKEPGENSCALESPGATAYWKLDIADKGFTITESVSKRAYKINCTNIWSLEK